MASETTVRLLHADDAAKLERFLEAHRDSSMFLRANARGGGLEYRGKPEQATYFGALNGGEVIGVAAQCWNGMMLVQAPGGIEALVCACVQSSGRKVTGFAGPLDQVRRARGALDFTRAPAATNEVARMSTWLRHRR